MRALAVALALLVLSCSPSLAAEEYVELSAPRLTLAVNRHEDGAVIYVISRPSLADATGAIEAGRVLFAVTLDGKELRRALAGFELGPIPVQSGWLVSAETANLVWWRTHYAESLLLLIGDDRQVLIGPVTESEMLALQKVLSSVARSSR